MSTLDLEQRQHLHGADYAARFEGGQDPMRVGRILSTLPLPHKARILDVGCGNALTLESLNKRRQDWQDYVGVDFSKELLESAAQRKQRLGLDNVRFINGPLSEGLAQCGSGWADVALALDVSEHVPDNEWIHACRDVHALLRPSGRFILHTPNLDFIVERMKQNNFVLKQFPEHIAVRTATENVRLLRESGFGKITCETIAHYNVLRFVHPLSHLPVLGKYFQARLLITAVKE